MTAAVGGRCGRVAKARFTAVTVDEPEWQQLHRVADRGLASYVRPLAAAVTRAATAVAAAVEAAPPSQSDEVAQQTWQETEPGLLVSVAEAGRVLLRQAGRVASDALARQLGLPVAKQQRAEVAIRFDLEHPEARRWAARRAAQLVREVSDETRAAIRQLTARAFRDGTPTATLARQLRTLVGLTQRQVLAVVRYREGLAADPGLSPARADRLADQYADRLHRERALTIARTETMRAANEGQRLAWLQAREVGALTDHDQREWIVTPDDALCDRCAPVADHPPVGLRQPFETDAGPLMTPPLHPRCRCVVGIVFGDA